MKTLNQNIGLYFLTDSLIGTLIAENFSYLGLYDVVTIIFLYSVLRLNVKHCNIIVCMFWSPDVHWATVVFKPAKKGRKQSKKEKKSENKTAA